jgi:hypothetical protein
MRSKVWSAQELDALSGAECEKIFMDSLVYDLALAPEALVARAQEFVLGRIANEASPS